MNNYKYLKYKNKYEKAKNLIKKYKQFGGDSEIYIFVNDGNLEKLEKVLDDHNDTDKLIIISFGLNKSENGIIQFYIDKGKKIELNELEKIENMDELVNFIYESIIKICESNKCYLNVIQGHASDIEKKLINKGIVPKFIKSNLNYYLTEDKDKIITIKKNKKDLTTYEKERIFILYKISYEKVEKETGRIILDIEQLLSSYTDIVYFVNRDDIFGGFLSNKIKGKRTSNIIANKISVILNDDKNFSKQYIFDILVKLLVSNYGYILEASGAVSHILKSRYNIKPNNIEKVKLIYEEERLVDIKNDTIYTRLTPSGHRIEEKELFGKMCTQDYRNFAKVMVMSDRLFDGCELDFDELKYKSYLSTFDNLFSEEAILKFLSPDFPPYSDMDSEAIVTNLVQDNKVIINDIPDENSFNIKTNGFALINLYEEFPEIKEILEKIKLGINIDITNTIDEEKNRKELRNSITELALTIVQNMEKRKQIFGDESFPDFDDAICLDAVPRDTNPNNEKSKFRGINLVHCDIYPKAYIGDVLWSFRNTWYKKIECVSDDIKEENLDKIENRDKWNDKIVGIYNFWISLTDGITDNGLAVLDTTSVPEGSLIPYKAFRPASRLKDNVNFISSSLTYTSNQRWYTKYNMKFGDCFIFDTKGSPHTGFKYSNGTNKQRKSVECRVLFMKSKSKSQVCSLYQPDSVSVLPGDEVIIDK